MATSVSLLRGACVTFGAGGALIGLTALIGWIVGNEVLRGSFGFGITMKTNAAIGVTLSGIFVALMGVPGSTPRRAWFERGCAGVVLAIGALTFGQHMFGVDLGIDQLLFREPPGAAATESPNRMGPMAALCFTLLAAARLLCRPDRPRSSVPLQWLSLTVALLTSVPLLGYLFEARALFGISKYTGIALPTALALWMFALGLLVARPERGFMRRLLAEDSGALLVRRLLPAAVFVPLLLMLVRISGERFGWYEQPLGRALLVMSFIAVFALVVWRTGDVVSRQERQAMRAERELNERLLHSLEQFRTLGEAVPDLLWMTDAAGAPLYQNPAWRRYTGLSSEALETATWESLAHPSDAPLISERLDEARRRGEPCELEARLRNKEGTHRWFSLRAVPVRDESNAVVKWIGAGTDIHERKQTQEAIAGADRRKTEFLAVLAHELRNPLAPVRTAVHLLRSGGGSDPSRIYSIIERQIEHLARLIDDLMDVGRISEDKLELRRSHASLFRVIAGAVEASRYLIDAHRHQLSLSLPEVDLALDADAARLVQVFTNLLTNAARYTPPDGHISLSAKRSGFENGGEGELVIAVSDDGVGIAAEDLSHVFDMFFQADRAGRTGQQGMGIGLSLVKKLVELHGGSVVARSEGRGLGSSFEVRLPASIVLGNMAPAALDSSPPSLTFSDLSVLVVEDNQDSAEMLTDLLQRAGATVHTAHDGESALALGAEFQPQIILLDIGLPGISGYDVAREARRARWGAQAFIVALTGWGQPADRSRSHDAGFDRHLVKPVNPDSLMAMIAEFRRSTAEQSASA